MIFNWITHIATVSPWRIAFGVIAVLSGVGAALAQTEPSPSAYGELAANSRMISETRSGLEEFFGMFGALFNNAPTSIDAMMRVLQERSPTGDPLYFYELIGLTTLILLGSMAFVIVVFGVLILRPWFIAQKKPNPHGVVEKLPILLLRAALALFGITLSVIIAVIVGAELGHSPDDDATKETIIIVVGAYVAIRLVTVTWRVILAPYLEDYRIPAFSNHDARKLFHWLWITAALALIFQAYCLWMAALNLPLRAHAVITSTLTFVIVLMNVAMVFANNRAVAAAIRGGLDWVDATWPSRWASVLWGPVVITYAVVSWFVMTLNLAQGREAGPPLIISAYVILLTAMVVYGVATFLIQRFFLRRRMRVNGEMAADPPPGQDPASALIAAVAEKTQTGEGAGDPQNDDGSDSDEFGGPPTARKTGAEPLPHQQTARGRMKSFEDLAGRIASVFAVAAGIYALYSLWVEEALMISTPWLEASADIAFTLLLGYIAYHALRIWIDQKIEEEGGLDPPAEPGEGEGGAGASRLATLLPLFRNFLLASITITVALIIALELGVNVAPLFAGAGIVGLALGFGAQALVRDILSGAFFLIDDAFRKGEYVDLGDVKGTVEKISVRSFQLRHHLGYLHTVPFGEIQFLTNFSRDWVIMRLPLRLTYDTDVEKVRKMVKKLGLEMAQNPDYGHKFIQPLKSQGVVQMEDSAMIMRVKFMTRPGEQWVLRKTVFAEIRNLFEREGIKFAHREVTVRLADAHVDDLTPDQQKAIAGAVRPMLDPETPAKASADDR